MIRKYYFNSDKRRMGSTVEGDDGMPPVLSGGMPDAAYVIQTDLLPDSALLLDPEHLRVLHIALIADGMDENGEPVFTEVIDGSKEPIRYA